MAEHEYPYLEKPEILEYPTETWAAQDLRKCEVFQFALKHASGAERERLAERAHYFFDSAVGTLSALPTRTLCRPMVLLLSFGWSRAWFLTHPEVSAPDPPAGATFEPQEFFVPQKARAVRRVRLLLASGAFVAVSALLAWIAAVIAP
jgi:hypothetical protein